MPAVAGDDPKYVGDVWVVEKLDHLTRQGVTTLLGVFDTLEGAQKFSEQFDNNHDCLASISKIAFYTTKWSDTNEE